MSRNLAPDDPRHGTPMQPKTRLVAYCTCPTCEDRRRYARRNYKLRQRGQGRTTTPARTQAHLKFLHQHGWVNEAIAAECGIGVATVCEIDRGVPKRIWRTTEAAILTVTGPARGHHVPAHGTRRRLEALAALGWPPKTISARAGLHPGFGRCFFYQNYDRVKASTADAIDAVFRELCMTPAPESAVSAQMRSRAQTQGWLPPLAWDDIDDPNEVPSVTALPVKDEIDEAAVLRMLDGRRVESTVAEKSEAMRRWLDAGGLRNEFARQMNWPSHRYAKGYVPNRRNQEESA
jgi:hypothetical protein